MKLCFKIAFAAIIITVLPVIIITVYRRSSSTQSNFLSAKDHLADVVQAEQTVLDSMFSDYVREAKVFAGNRSVLEFVDEADSRADGDLHSCPSYAGVEYEAELYMRSCRVYAMQVIDRNNTVIYSSEEGAEGSRSEFSSDEGKTYYNGISSLFIYDDTPLFCVERDIFADNNESVGKVCIVYEAEVVSDSIKVLEKNKFNRVLIIDSNTNIIESPFKSVRNLDWNAEYKNFSQYVRTFLSKKDNKDFMEFYDYKFQGKPKAALIQPVSISGWSVIGLVNLRDYDKHYYRGIGFIWIIVVLEIAAFVFVLLKILSPLSKIREFLEKRQKGDNTITLSGSESDELGQISTLLNTVMDRLSASEEKYRAIAEMSDNIVFDINIEKSTVTVSSNFNKKFSFRPKDETLQESFLYKCHVYKDDKPKYLAGVNNILNSNETKWEGDYRMKTLYGDFSWIRIKARKLINRKDVPTRIIGIMTDIDRQKESELNLIQKASFDALTQLYNRETFLKMLKTETEKPMGKSSLSAIMFIDLDDFKFFNDEYGHNCGDEVLKFTASTIKEACFERGFGGRFGGDEFIICFTGLKLIGNAGEIAGSIINTLAAGFESDSAENLHLSIKCSIGISFLGENGSTPEELIAAADSAMYKIKKHGKSNFAYATADEKSERNLEAATSVIDSNYLDEMQPEENAPEEETNKE